ncbi:hypothetical protein H4R19_001639 [Coemansia spiralis]|nr:hypothetical protein H4R19_001639 [Coemansia spiralis]
MDTSHTATIGRSRRGLGSMHELLAVLAQPDEGGGDGGNDTVAAATAMAAADRPPSPAATSSSSASDEDDIDGETAMNTVYNLLSELGDLNRTNRRTAEALAERFSVLQAQVSRVEGMGSDDLAEPQQRDRSRPTTPVPQPPEAEPELELERTPGPVGESPPSEAAFHTPPTTTGGSAHASMRLESPVTAAAIIATAPRHVPILVEGKAQTEMRAGDIDDMQQQADVVESENRELRADMGRLVGAIRDQQEMAREYEATLAKALVALRTAAFERHTELSDVQNRYQELLDKESSLNTRLQDENARLKVALGRAARLVRSALDVDADDNDEPSSTHGESPPSSAVT